MLSKEWPITPFHSQVTQPESSHLRARACLAGSPCNLKDHVFCGFTQEILRPWDGLTDHQGKVGLWRKSRVGWDMILMHLY